MLIGCKAGLVVFGLGMILLVHWKAFLFTVCFYALFRENAKRFSQISDNCPKADGYMSY